MSYCEDIPPPTKKLYNEEIRIVGHLYGVLLHCYTAADKPVRNKKGAGPTAKNSAVCKKERRRVHAFQGTQ